MRKIPIWAVKERKRQAAKAVEFDGTRKRCKGACGELKELRDFSPQVTGIGGVRSICRTCRRDDARQAYRESDRYHGIHERIGFDGKSKVCTGCNIRKPLTDFHSHPNAAGKTANKCKSCASEYARSKNTYGSFTEFAEQRVAYDPVNQTKRCSRCENIKELKDFGPLKTGLAGRHSVCRECLQRQNESPKYRSWNLLNGMISRSRKKGREVTITREWIETELEKGRCSVTGLPFHFGLVEKSHRNQHPFAPSIDRLDNTKGYTPENCRITVFACNAGKSEFSHEDVLTMARALIRTQEPT